MSRIGILLIIVGVVSGAADLVAQTKRPTRKPVARATTVREPAALECPAMLGTGISTRRQFCDVLTGREAKGGIVVKVPPHTGTATLTFELHNRHTYSEQETQAGAAFARYTASIMVLTPKNEILSRGAVQSEFRKASDLIDRVDGGAGPKGVKAVAPTGTERISVTIPANVAELSIVAEKLDVVRRDGRESFNSPGRPVAVISNAVVEYRPTARRRR